MPVATCRARVTAWREPRAVRSGFHPDYVTAFPKIEREVHAAVLAVCDLVRA